MPPTLYEGLFGYRGTLARAPLVGGPPRELAESVAESDWNPDGRQLAIVRTSTVGDARRTSIEFPIGHQIFEALDPNWLTHLRISPTGQYLAFIRHLTPGDDGGEVVVCDKMGKIIATAGPWMTAQGLAWRPDGREVWFTAARTGGIRTLHGVSLDGDQREMLSLPTSLTLQDIAADGRVLITSGQELGELRGRLKGATADQALSAYDWPVVPMLSRDGTLLVFLEGGEATRASGYTVFLRRAGDKYPVRLGPGEVLLRSRLTANRWQWRHRTANTSPSSPLEPVTRDCSRAIHSTILVLGSTGFLTPDGWCSPPSRRAINAQRSCSRSTGVPEKH